MRNALYTLFTWVICLVANWRQLLCDDAGDLRWERTLDWDEPEKDAGKGVLYACCCDCGLTHFFVLGKPVTPERPPQYRYRLRAGRGPKADPDPILGIFAKNTFRNWCEKESA